MKGNSIMKLIHTSNKESSLTAAAKNIRIELRAAFPSVKFSVRSERFAGGNSINVFWTDGPTSDQVDAIIGKYQAGSFDGMQDLYIYERSDFRTKHGEAKYVFPHRMYSDTMVANVLARVCRHLGGLDRELTVEDYRKGRIWNVYTSGGCDVARELTQALQKHTYAVAQGVQS